MKHESEWLTPGRPCEKVSDLHWAWWLAIAVPAGILIALWIVWR